MGTQLDNVRSKIMKIFHDENAVSEIIGEVLLTAIAVLAFSVIAVFVFSYLESEDAVHADIDGWVDVSSSTIYLRHSGGENIDLNNVELVLNLNGTRRDISSSQLEQILGSSSWHLGQTIVIDTDVLWNTTINGDDYVGMILIQTNANAVIESVSLLGEEVEMDSGSGSNVTPTQYAPVADFTYLPSNPDTVQTVTFTDQSSDSDGTVAGWSWNFGDGGISTDQNTSHQYSSAGNYTITLTVTDDDGNTDSSSQGVTVTVPVSSVLPVSRWKFDEGSGSTAYDSIDDNDASLNNASWSSTAKNGTAMYFNGTGYLVVTDSDSLDFDQDLSLVFWLNIDDKKQTYCLIGKGMDNQDNFDLFVTGGELRFEWTNAGYHYVETSGMGLKKNTWYQIAVVVDGSDVKFYKDATFVESGPMNGFSLVPNNHDLWMGRQNYGSNDYYFHGYLDEVEIYNVTLDESDMAAYYARTTHE
ncbi:LamG-like jellyroll fold domain-containing protein [Methanolobus sediminis]|uniref:LamG-like jellyroll fold domain-containing protein n=1 Tax=Methanolobus sediminis TaxID=3072978 RepID=A0AA51YL90_9EURY|nr:LamG-like jellyroll fold domain-containing protein [Methanolobus sediminis]WMW24734.1 LamG-like jellyroll fold domain-containing protein [Methanolobus sediminis]